MNYVKYTGIMAELRFDKSELGNLEYSLQRELLSTNRAGGYINTTIIGCNTRKYHGLFVAPVEELADSNFVLLSSLDETVIQHGQEFNLAIHRYPGVYEPRGHKYIIDFAYTPVPALVYKVGGVVLKKEMIWRHSKEQLMLRYTLLEASSPTTLRLRPFLAFRNIHQLSKANMDANVMSEPVKTGVRNRLYDGFPYLYMQLNVEHEFVPAPEWYYNFEYLEERDRGYPYTEDLLTTGFFEMSISKGQSVVFSCSTREFEDPSILGQKADEAVARRSVKLEFLPCLRHSARQFIVRRGEKTEVVAGYPWFGRWGRDTFISLPGVSLAQGDVQSCIDVVDTMTSEMKNGLFPNIGTAYNSVDAPMWFFWTLQQLEKHQDAEFIWTRYGKNMKDVLESYRRGIGVAIRVDENGLVYTAAPDRALTWMDAVVHGVPVTPRNGAPVEVNALWYNGICYTLELARRFGDNGFVERWETFPDKVKESFNRLFWYEKEGYLADFVTPEGGQNTFIRPNQIIACSLPYCMVDDEVRTKVANIVELHLLTPKGLRTLSPRNPFYKGRCEGDQPTRDKAYHQGTVWPWLLEHYVKTNFDLYGKGYLPDAMHIVNGFEEDIFTYCIGSIAEIYDADPPHQPRGAISQAWSVAAVLRIVEMIEKYEQL